MQALLGGFRFGESLCPSALLAARQLASCGYATSKENMPRTPQQHPLYSQFQRQHTACDMIRRCSIPYAAKSKALQCGVPKHLAKLLKGDHPDLQLVAANALMRSKPHYCSHAHLCHYRLVGPSAV